MDPQRGTLQGVPTQGGDPGLQPAAVQESSVGSQLSTVHEIRQLIYSHICIPTNDDRFFPMWLESDLDQHYGWVGSLLQLYFGSCVVICLPQNLLCGSILTISVTRIRTILALEKKLFRGLKSSENFLSNFQQLWDYCSMYSSANSPSQKWHLSNDSQAYKTLTFYCLWQKSTDETYFTCLKFVNCLIISGITVWECWQFDIQTYNSFIKK